MLQLTKISKGFGIETLFTEVSFEINHAERVGLIGPNGCGKTTLFRIVMGLEEADGGHLHLEAGKRIGYLPQALDFEPTETMAEVLASATADHQQAWHHMEQIASEMAQSHDTQLLAELTHRYAAAEAQFEAAGGYALESRLDIVLAGLDLDQVSRDLPIQLLSGGQKTRLGLARLLIQQPHLLLLDEPTNHLDVEALQWLEGWLGQYDGVVLIVSHDRAFLDAVITRTLVIDSITHRLRDFPGNYSTYLETVHREAEQQWQAYQAQQQDIAKLRQAAQHLRGQAKFRKGGKADTPDKFAKAHFANRSAATMGRAKQLERQIEQLQGEDRIDKPARQWELRVNFAQDTGGARQVLSLDSVGMSFGEKPLFQDISLTLTHGQRVALIGPNGHGKTTLLRLIAGELTPSVGEVRVGSGVKLGYLAQEQELLDPATTPYDTIVAALAEKAADQSETRRFLHHFLFSGDEVFTKIVHLSFGERTRLMLALLVAQDCNFLLMDEPTNYLDIPSREQFEQALLQFPGTVLAVVHDRRFIERIATAVWELRDGKIRRQA